MLQRRGIVQNRRAGPHRRAGPRRGSLGPRASGARDAPLELTSRDGGDLAPPRTSVPRDVGRMETPGNSVLDPRPGDSRVDSVSAHVAQEPADVHGFVEPAHVHGFVDRPCPSPPADRNADPSGAPRDPPQSQDLTLTLP